MINVMDSNIKPEMRLYGVDDNYFETIDELLRYCRQKRLSTQKLTLLDYYRNFFGYKDVIRKANSSTSIFYAASDEESFVWYGDELNMHGENWLFSHGQIRSLYKPFRDHGIVFEDDIYARESEKNQHIMKYCRKNNIFNSGEKDKK